MKQKATKKTKNERKKKQNEMKMKNLKTRSFKIDD